MHPSAESQLKRKPRNKPKPYNRQVPTGRKKTNEGQKTSATSSGTQDKGKSRENLTLHDWLTILRYVDEHPRMSQAEVVTHFKTLSQGALIFTQSTLSRKVSQRADLGARATVHPNALSAKRLRVHQETPRLGESAI